MKNRHTKGTRFHTYILLVGLGLKRVTGRRCGVFTIGRIMLDRMQVPIAQLVAALVEAVEEAAPNWR